VAEAYAFVWTFVHRDIFKTIILDGHRIITGGSRAGHGYCTHVEYISDEYNEEQQYARETLKDASACSNACTTNCARNAYRKN
jgi:hypothetical protein